MRVKRLILAVSLAVAATAAPAEETVLVLRLPQALIDSGLDTHLLPRFRFKTRIRVEPVARGAADIALAEGAGTPVFRAAEGAAWGVDILTDDAARAGLARQFLDWLRSDPGRTALAAFEIDGEPLVPGAEAVAEVEEIELEGDAELGARLALTHCGRCHVVDGRNPFGGIGSTPSFPAMRGQPDWRDRFAAFWTFNPHGAFTQVAEVTPPFPDERPPPIAPLELTLEETEAITAFVGTLTPKDLGAAVQAR